MDIECVWQVILVQYYTIGTHTWPHFPLTAAYAKMCGSTTLEVKKVLLPVNSKRTSGWQGSTVIPQITAANKHVWKHSTYYDRVTGMYK